VSIEPCGVLRAVEHDDLRLRRDQRGQLGHVGAELPLGAQRQRHRLRAGVVDHRLVDREPGIRVDGLVALLEQREEHEEHHRLGAGVDHHLVGLAGHAAAPGAVLGDGLAQGGQAGRGAVVREALAEGFLRGVHDVRRRVEIGLADLEVHHVLALRLEGAGAGQDFKGGLGPETRHAGGELHRGESTRSRRPSPAGPSFSQAGAPPRIAP
jgi:hypothetical protein